MTLNDFIVLNLDFGSICALKYQRENFNKTNMRIFLIVLIGLGFLDVNSQVTKVKYFMRYNTSTTYYDCHIVVTAGNATTTQERLQGGSQYSVIVPTGSFVEIINLNMPLKNNQNYTGTEPTIWVLGNQIFAPAAQSQSDFYGITNSVSPSSFFNNIVTNDTIRLFSLNVTLPSGACTSSVRLFKNGVDPSSSSPGMGGGDFSNGFVLGLSSGSSQDYDGNLDEVYPTQKVLNFNDTGIGSLRKAIECAGPNSQIIFDPSTYNDTIRLVSKIQIAQSLKILQSPTTIIKIKGGINSSVFEVLAGKNVEFSNIDIINRPIANLIGRSIINNGNLTLNNVRIKDPSLNQGVGASLLNKGILTLKGQTSIKKI